MSQSVIEVQNVSYSYSKQFTSPNIENGLVLNDVSLTVAAGEYLAVLGPNGGGKTTLFKLLLGLLTPTKGSVKLFGQAPAKVLHKVGYVPQSIVTKPAFPASALDVVMMGFANREGKGLFGRWRHTPQERERAMHCLETVGLEALAQRRISNLSGGQRQRVLVARALVSDPQLLLLDEPTSSIDPQGKFCFYEFLAELRGPMTIVVVSHDLSIAGSAFSSVALVNKALRYNPHPTLTPEMLAMLYGTHDKTCPMGTFINTVSTIFPTLPQRSKQETQHGGNRS
ncbi:metal ABC transporter ATP-binding protein [Oleidesulfovibrio sp.]|uniref:metal ABC transporter ATP-binding protein n=1 Tax=Oleidesulfovibrio sp. TaxID=2909707 RepID=UPI003A8AD619